MEQYVNTEKILNDFAFEVIRQAQSNLTVTQKGEGVRAEWVKVGGKWKPKSFKRKQFNKKINATGDLFRSLDYDVSGTSVKFSMLDYGYYVDQGRRGILTKPKSASGLGAPVRPNVILKWQEKKKLKLRESGTGRFKRVTDEARKGLAFVINRKIKWFGIDATKFFSEPFQLEFESLPRDVAEALIQDLKIKYDK